MIRHSFVIATILCAVSASAFAQGPSFEVRLVAALHASFGGATDLAYSFQAGSSLALFEEVQRFARHNSLPVSGLSYTPGLGLAPVILGNTLAPNADSTTLAEENSGVPWGWIAGGAAIVAGIVLATGSDDDKPQEDSGPTPENSCVFLGDNLSEVSVNPECNNGGGG